jgi:ketosteroid isomerase-like protein
VVNIRRVNNTLEGDTDMRHLWRRQHLFPSLTVAVILVASSAGAQSSKAATEQELREAVNNYMAGYGSNTVEGYFANYANDVTYWWPNGLRQQREAYHKTWTDTLAGGNTVVSSVAEDVLVHAAPAGDAGVASFLWKISRKNGAPYALQTSTTWFKRDGHWQIVHMHFNRVAAPGGRGAQPPQGAGAAGRGAQAPPAAAPPAPPLPTAGPGKEVREVIAKLTQAYGANDIDGYFAIYAPELTWWGPAGRSDKESYRKFWTESVKTTGGLASAENDDLRIQVAPHGDLAVASYLLKVKRNNPGENRPPNVTYEMSPTLIKRGGNWTIVHLHFQVAPEPKPAG